jgi:transcriptional regulator with XRE-family HTH domain
MERTGLTQTEIGRITGRDRTMANRWTAGRSRPAYEAATALAAAINEQHPDLAEQLLAAAGYRPSTTPEQPLRSSAAQVVDDLRAVARRESKTIGDVLVERGLATPEDLTLSDRKKGDPIVQEILQSDLSEETKNILLLQYVGERRTAFQKLGVAEEPELAQKKPRGA